MGAPPGAPAGGPAPKDGKTLVAAILTALALILVATTTFSHGWLRPERMPDDVSGGFGLTSYKVEHEGESDSESYFKTLDRGRGDAKTFAAGSLLFAGGNYLVMLFLLLGTIFGFARWAAGKSAGVPFAMTLVAAIVGFVFFLAWVGIAVVGGDMWEDTKFGWCVSLWWVGWVATLVAMILFVMVRSAKAYGAGFQGAGQFMPAGQGIVGPQYGGGGYVPNPADQLRGGPPPGAPAGVPQPAPPPQAAPPAPGAWPPPQAAPPAPGQAPAPWPPQTPPGTPPQGGGGGWPPPR
jgi:hypothetical protein